MRALLKAPCQCRWYRCRATLSKAHRMQIVVMQLWPVAQYRQNLGHAVQDRDTLLLNEPQALTRVEALHQHYCGAGHCCKAHEHYAIDVIKRHEDQHTVSRGDAGSSYRLVRITHHVLMSEHDTLGQSSCAAAVRK